MMRFAPALIGLAIGAAAIPCGVPATVNSAGIMKGSAAVQSAPIRSSANVTDRKAELEMRRLEAETRYAEKYYEHLERLNKIAADKFVWQDRASEVILWLVAMVVIGGISLTAFQLWMAFGKAGAITETTLEASAKNFRVTSSVVGIIVLVISVSFLYLFLREVYHIEIVGVSGRDQPGAQSARNTKSLEPADFGLPAPLPEGTVVLKEKPKRSP
jgi:hypothetical protein